MNLEIKIEAKSFRFSTILSSISFRVVEEGKRFVQTVDFNLQEALWLISALRNVYSEGHHVGKWKSRFFSGRNFVLTCKSNFAGDFVEFAIFGAKRRLKALVIPAGIDLIGVKAFADAFAATTAGPEKRTQAEEAHARGNSDITHASGAVDGRSFAAVAAGIAMVEAPLVADEGADSQVGTWSMVWGLLPEQWSFETFQQIKMVPGVRCVVPVMAARVELMVLFKGDRSQVPRAASVVVEGRTTRVFFDVEVTERVAGLLDLFRGEGNYLEGDKNKHTFDAVQIPFTEKEIVGEKMGQVPDCGRVEEIRIPCSEGLDCGESVEWMGEIHVEGSASQIEREAGVTFQPSGPLMGKQVSCGTDGNSGLVGNTGYDQPNSRASCHTVSSGSGANRIDEANRVVECAVPEGNIPEDMQLNYNVGSTGGKEEIGRAHV